MKKTSVMEKIERYEMLINSKYDMTHYEIQEIRDCSHSEYRKLVNSFILGYAKGQKAAMAEMKKKAKEAKAV